MDINTLKKQIISKNNFTDVNGNELNIYDPVFCIYHGALYSGIVVSFETKKIKVRLFRKELLPKETICCYPFEIGLINKTPPEFINKQIEQAIEDDNKQKREKIKCSIYLMYINNNTDEYGITAIQLKMPNKAKKYIIEQYNEYIKKYSEYTFYVLSTNEIFGDINDFKITELFYESESFFNIKQDVFYRFYTDATDMFTFVFNRDYDDPFTNNILPLNNKEYLNPTYSNYFSRKLEKKYLMNAWNNTIDKFNLNTDNKRFLENNIK